MEAITATAPKQPKPRKPRPKPERRIRVLEQPTPDTDHWGAIEITVGKQTDRYLVHFLPSDFGDGGIGFEVEKLDTDLNAVEVYHTHLSDNPADRACDCKGCLRHGHCKHVAGLEALARSGQLKALPLPMPKCRSTGDLAANDPEEYERLMAAHDDSGYVPRDFYPDEPPQLDIYADYEPGEDGRGAAA